MWLCMYTSGDDELAIQSLYLSSWESTQMMLVLKYLLQQLQELERKEGEREEGGGGVECNACLFCEEISSPS